MAVPILLRRPTPAPAVPSLLQRPTAPLAVPTGTDINPLAGFALGLLPLPPPVAASIASGWGKAGTPLGTSPANTPFENQVNTVVDNMHAARAGMEQVPTRVVKGIGDYFGTPSGQLKPAVAAPVDNDNLTRLLVQLTPPGKGGVNAFAAPGVVPTTYDPTYDLKAMDALKSSAALAATPKTVNLGPNVWPKIPDAPVIAPTDFTAYDQHMALAAPKAPTAADMHQTRVNGVLGGLARAAGDIGSDTPVGSMLLKIGAGMLAGKTAANDDIHKELDRYEQKQSAYEMALAQGDVEKARTLHEDATQNANKAWEVTKLRIADSRPTIEGGMIITHQKDADGNDTVTTTPISNAAAADSAVKMAGIYEQMGRGKNAANAATVNDQNQRSNTDAALRVRATLAGNKDGTVDPAVAIGLGVGRAWEQGTYDNTDLVPKETMDALKKRAIAASESVAPLGMGGSGGDAARLAAYRSNMVQSLISLTVQSPPLSAKIFGSPMATIGARTATTIKPRKDSQR